MAKPCPGNKPTAFLVHLGVRGTTEALRQRLFPLVGLKLSIWILRSDATGNAVHLESRGRIPGAKQHSWGVKTSAEKKSIT